MIYVIIGPSSSGKSSARRQITRLFGISGIDTDTLRTMTQILCPDVNVGHLQDVPTNRMNLRTTVRSFLYARSFFEEDYLLEGDAIDLPDIKEAMNHYPIKCIVIGYPNDTYEDRISIYHRSHPSYWIHTVEQATWGGKVKDNIRYSQRLQKESYSLGLPYLDVTSQNTIEQNLQLIIKALDITS